MTNLRKLRWLEYALIVVGLLTLGYCLFVYTEAWIFRAYENRVFDRIHRSHPETLLPSPGTAEPWESGSVGIAGHRDTVFRALGKLAQNDKIVLTTFEGSHRYAVQSMEAVGPQELGCSILPRTQRLPSSPATP